MATTKAKALITRGVLGRFDTKPGRHGVKGVPGLKLQRAQRRATLLDSPLPRRRPANGPVARSLSRREVRPSAQEVPRPTLSGDGRRRPDRRPARATAEGGGAASAVALTFAQEAERFIERKEKRHSPPPVARDPAQGVTEILGPMPIAKIDTATVLKVLEPMWTKTPETASRVTIAARTQFSALPSGRFTLG
jgi:hypothetical protein